MFERIIFLLCYKEIFSDQNVRSLNPYITSILIDSLDAGKVTMPMLEKNIFAFKMEPGELEGKWSEGLKTEKSITVYNLWVILIVY